MLAVETGDSILVYSQDANEVGVKIEKLGGDELRASIPALQLQATKTEAREALIELMKLVYATPDEQVAPISKKEVYDRIAEALNSPFGKKHTRKL